jgi:predicted enzyme related to lactoylglutathione lyase
MPRVMHFEIPSDNPEKAMDFYRNVFGWGFSRFGEYDYWMTKSDDSEKGIDGAIMKRMDPAQPVVNSLMVDSVDDFAKKIESEGGQIVVPKMPIGDFGFVAYFKDLDGNIFGIAEFSKQPPTM